MSQPIWYVYSVKSKRNKDWTFREKVQAYTLREKEEVPRKEIAKKLKVSLTQVDNQIRMMRKYYRNRCHRCGKPLSEIEKRPARPGQVNYLCLNCKKEIKDYKKELRKKALKRKLCGICYKNPVIPGKTACRSCLSATHRRRYANHLCGQCGKRKIAKGKETICEICAQEMKAVSKNWRLTHA